MQRISENACCLIRVKKMKKVLIDLSVLKHLNCGLGQVAYNYAKYFEANAKHLDFEVHLLVPKSYIGAFGNDVFYHQSKELYTMFPSLLPKFDVWHAIHQLSRFKPSRKKTPTILTIHDLNFLYEKEPAKIKKYSQRIAAKIRQAKKIVCISNFAKNDVQKHFQTKKPIEVLYNGVEFMSADVEKRPAAVTSDRPFLFSIGQLMPKKNFHVMLDTMKLLPQYDFYLAGKDNTDYAEMMRKRIKEEHIDNVHLMGEILHSEKVWLYNHCTAFVFPSLFEGFGLPIIEAMFFEKPVISSNQTSLQEIGADHVTFIEHFEPDYIASKIQSAISEFTEEKAQSNRAYAMSFSYEKHLGRYVEIYRELFNN